ncbi:cupin domain-containing protein [Pseudomonas aeruginosa]|nr:cupin domain-containing protein [Pseudomonas aeruginosa]
MRLRKPAVRRRAGRAVAGGVGGIAHRPRTRENPVVDAPCPFQEEDYQHLPEQDWTLLVQAVDQFVPEVAQLLEQFRLTASPADRRT